MFNSSNKMIVALAITAGLLSTHGAFAKGGSNKSGSGGGGGNSSRSISRSISSSSLSSSSLKSVKLNTNNGNSNNHSNSISGISKKPVTLSQTFKKQNVDIKKFDIKKIDVNKINKNNSVGISINNLKKDNHSKDLFCKKNDKCWFDWWCYSKKSCYPYFGCYYPTYSCFDYCLPTYTTCNYVCDAVTVLPTVVPTRSVVAVGSILMVNGQAFGPVAGGARLNLNGMALPIEVLEWSPVGVKVRLPMLQIGGVTPAEIEVFRGDGSLASKTPIDLTGVAAPLALGR